MKALIFGGMSDMAEPIVKRWPKSERCIQDVRNSPLVERAVEESQPDIIINLAGVSHVQSVFGSSPALWADEIEINLLGSYYIARAAAAYAPNAIMIFLASVAGLYGKPQHSGYSASKAGIVSLVQSLGMEGYKAFAISPGRVDTKMREHDYPGEDKRTRLSVEQIADVIFRIVEGEWKSGTNIWIRKVGFDTYGPEAEHTAEIRQRWLNVQPVVPPSSSFDHTGGTPRPR